MRLPVRDGDSFEWRDSVYIDTDGYAAHAPDVTPSGIAGGQGRTGAEVEQAAVIGGLAVLGILVIAVIAAGVRLAILSF